VRRALKGIRATAVATGLAVLVQGLGTVATGPSADAGTSEVTAITRVHVRSKPTTSSSSLTILSKGDKLKASGTTNGWTKVTYHGKTAYVYSQYLKGASSSSSTNATTSVAKGTWYTTANLNLRTGASTKHSSYVILGKGRSVTLTGKASNGFAQLTYKGKTLWASRSYLTQSKPSTSSSLPKVTGQKRGTTVLMIRTTSTSSFTSLGDAPKGTIFDVTGTVKNGMAQIIWKSNVRWVNNKYLTSVGGSTNSPSASETPATTTKYATAVLNVWAKSTGSSYSGEIAKGSKLAVTGTVKNSRAEIVYNGAIKWVTSKYVSSSKPSSSASSGNSSSLNKGYSSGLDKTNANVQAIARDVWNRFPQIKTMYGWRRDVTPDHPAGRAVDVMIPGYKSNQDLGWTIARYYRANARKYNINYIIFGQKIWNIARDSEGWRSMADRGGDTANHYDHVHINTYG